MKDWIGRLALSCAAVAITLGALEAGLRLAHAPWITAWPNFVLEARRVLADRELSRFVEDPFLGYVPRPGYAAAGLSFDKDGFRRTGGSGPGDGTGGTVLAVGDSYTYGDEVTDGETWPAHLQRLGGGRVLNAGVSGYGFDQSVLRAEKIAAGRSLDTIVVSFIADDVHRTEMSRLWGANKPYFEIAEGRLVLRNVPVPPRPEPQTTLTIWQRTLGYSFLVDFVLRRLNLLHDWFGDHVRVNGAGQGARIACLLTGRLAELRRNSGARVLLMAQYDPVVWQNPTFADEQRRVTADVLRCGREAGLEVLDTFEPLASGNPGALYGRWHMNDAGNRRVAALVAAAIGNGN
ncbi:MAG TPA: GDSL-type esterase/lipase family protein [Reyranella sp.]|nr:GDSL-type esterase/lipase family protein [Reyranella sp.]